MLNFPKGFGLSTLVPSLVLGGAMGATTVFAQAPMQAQPSDSNAWAQTAPSPSTDLAQPSSANPDETSTYATGKPLENQSKEGFWGHMNPFARKKWVRREVDPVKDRVNELDQLQAKNANDIRDVDQRSQAGINNAMMAANTADQHAADAANRANAAQNAATDASTRTDALNGTVSNLDQYRQVTSTNVPFAAGRTMLGPKGKADLDNMASKLAGERGYIIEVQGYSKGGVQMSQAMADSVVRYLVTEHQVSLYRIYRTGLGRQTEKPANADATGDTANETAIVNGVRVTLLHNSLAAMGGASASNSSPAPAMPGQAAQPGFNQ
jgi:outer membrane protein OmpA-like peptidoglycan-associated protein